MYIELESVFNIDGETRRFDYAFDAQDSLITSDVHVAGRVYNKSGIVTLEAKADYAIDTVCALCASDIREDRTTEVEHILLNYPANEEDIDRYIVVEGARLELDELIREDIFLSMPMRFLCRSDCKGLCSICGADLNKGECGCSRPVDSRWDLLKELF